eukprot:Skav211332  [mRNA]  locus=scaffold3120:141185:146842:- [translate_table: standard]
MRLCEFRYGATISLHHVYGHQGNPGNEAADALALAAAEGRPSADWSHYFAYVSKKTFVHHADWFWFLFHSLGQGDWHGHVLELPGKPRHCTPCQNDWIGPPQQDCVGSGRLSLRLATCNVLTLRPSATSDDVPAVMGPSRAACLFRQFHDAGISMFAWQETRCSNRHRCRDDGLVIWQSAADGRGNYGMLAGFSRLLPHGFLDDGSPVVFTDDDISLICSEPRYLILRVQTAVLRCIVLAVHAPHRGESLDTIERFWTTVSQKVPSHYDGWDHLLLCDANAEVGASPSASVGSWQTSMGARGEKNAPFLDFVHTHALLLPSTFEGLHAGTGFTWKHQRGALTRIDYVGIPLSWQWSSCVSWIDQDIEIAMCQDDHYVACVEVGMDLPQIFTYQKQRARPPPRATMEDVDWERVIEACSTPISAHLDVHSHALLLQKRLSRAFVRQKSRPATPLKSSMSATTWELVQEKKKWRRHLADAQASQRLLFLQCCFEAWTHYEADDEEGDEGFVFCVDASLVRSMRRDQDRLVAEAYFQFRVLGRQVTSAMRHDDLQFFEDRLKDVDEFCSAAQAKQFWGVIRRSMPKFRTRRLHCDPGHIEALEEQWGPHFKSLELGQSCSLSQLWEGCQQRQAETAPAQDMLYPADLPSMNEIEDSCRAVRADKATGFDGVPSSLAHCAPQLLAQGCFSLFLKIFAWQSEPLFYKGGILATLPKKAVCSRAEHFRGVLLLPTLSKRLHGLLRQRIMTVLQPQRPPGQIGGFPHQEVLFGSQCLRTFGRLMDYKGISSGLLFLDLTQAFHRLVRELVVGVGAEQNVIDVLFGLACENGDVASVGRKMQTSKLLASLGVSPLLCQLLADIHHGTWYTLKHHFDLVVTRRGTRPGSPLADIIFHVLMLDVAEELRTWLASDAELQSIAKECDIVIEPILWSDDLAIPWASRTASALAPSIGRLMRVIKGMFRSRGFALNMDRGKTSVILTHRGKGAPDCRAQFLQADSAMLECAPSADDMEPLLLPVVSKYKHLGTYISENHSLEQEINVRIGIAQQTFASMSRAVFCNRHLALPVRVRLYRTLVESRLYFGLGAWATPTPAQLSRLQAAVLRFLQKILRLPLETRASMSAQEVFVRTGIAQPRVRLALDRLLYARRFFQHAPDFVIHMVMKEDQFLQSSSWLHGVCMDLRWVEEVRPGSLPSGWEQDLTDFFDWIQNPTTPWKGLLRQVWFRHLKQEEIGLRTLQTHKQIFRDLRLCGAEFDPSPFVDLDQLDLCFQCECGKSFSTGQGLATHRRKVHGRYSEEHHLLQGSCCPCCMRQFWCTQRLQQHLAYRSRRTGLNRCFQQLQAWGFHLPYEPCKMPETFAGLHRVEAVQMAGPMFQGPSVHQQEIGRLREELELTRAELCPRYVPDDVEECRLLLFQDLSLTTQDWFADFVAHGHVVDSENELPDLWLAVLMAGHDDLHDWAALQFLDWGDSDLGLVIDELADGEAEGLIDAAFYAVAETLTQYRRRQRCDAINHRLRHLQMIMDEPFPHRGTFGTARLSSRRPLPATEVPRAYKEQVLWHDRLRDLQWKTVPATQPVPLFASLSQRPCFLVCHLFSGRRRAGDFHEALHAWGERRGYDVRILSMDTAVSEWYGDLLSTSPSWRQLTQLYSNGWGAATLCGPPCETYTEARHNPPPADLPRECARRWPRPLRSFLEIFGLEGLSMRELKQLDYGTMFVLNMLRIAGGHLGRGGLFVMEHPGPPSQPERASIWSLALTQLFRRHPDCGFHVLSQWRWGALACKPTGFLTVGVPQFWKTMWQHHLPDAQRPESVAIGVDNQGRFKTTVLKEYPPQLCKALAESIGFQLEANARTGRVKSWPTAQDGISAELVQWVAEAASISARVDANASIRRDFQG